jgi:hypothetical protein
MPNPAMATRGNSLEASLLLFSLTLPCWLHPEKTTISKTAIDFK